MPAATTDRPPLKLMPISADRAIRRERRVDGEPDRRRASIASVIAGAISNRDSSGMSGVTTRRRCRELPRQRDEPRLVDAGGMQPGGQQRRAMRMSWRLVHPRRAAGRAASDRDLALAARLACRGPRCGEARPASPPRGRRTTAVHVRTRDEPPRPPRAAKGGGRGRARTTRMLLLTGQMRGPDLPDLHMKPLIIAIDGPSGAGKGTVARAIASALGYRHVDSGAMYRAVGWKALRDGVPLDDEDGVAALARRVAHRRHSATRDDRRRSTSRARSARRRSIAPRPRSRGCRGARRARRASARSSAPAAAS